MMCDGLVFVRTCSSGVCPRSLLGHWLNWAAAAQSGATGEQRTGTGNLRHSLICNWHAGVVSFKPNWSKRHLASLISIPISPSEEWLNIKDGRQTRVLILALPFFSFFLYAESVGERLWCRYQRLFTADWFWKLGINRYINIFIQHFSACFRVSQHTTDWVRRVYVKAVMRHTWAAPGLPHGIHRKDVHHNGPCVCETVSKQRRSKEWPRGTERCTTLIEIAFKPVW